jgi:DNA-directed RNA polymerase subunit alpha
MIHKNILLPGKINIISEDGNKGTYEIDKLYPGYGHTLGNSLRRVVLSSIEGVAVTRVFIDGVAHEFSTIDGVKEDAINLILNLKKVVFKMHSEEPVKLSINVSKTGEITAKDIELPSQVEIINSDQYLFTLEKGKKINIEFEISKGLGYVSKEQIKGSEKLKIGEIIMDASFTPIRRTSYKVSSTRVGDRTDFNKISFFIETDGSITPFESLTSSVSIMRKQLSALLDNNDQEQTDYSEGVQESIATLNLSEEILEKVATFGILNVSELKTMTDLEISKIDGISEKETKEIVKSLKK